MTHTIYCRSTLNRWVPYAASVRLSARSARRVAASMEAEGWVCEVREAGRVGVPVDRMLVRVTYVGTVASGPSVGWEVGAMDVDWCRLAAGVLCGGEQ